MCVTMAQESVSSASMPGAAYGDDDARDIPEKELYPAESAFAGPARVADQCDPAETVILHAPVDAVMTYTWDARRGRNLHVAWPANIPELARHEPPPPRTDGGSARGGGITPFDRTRTPGDSILVVKRGAERAAYPKAANAAEQTDTKEIEKMIEKTFTPFTPALRSLRAPRFPTAQAREASARWPQLLLRGQTHRRLNAFGPGVAPPGARLAGAPDWALNEDDDDEDETATEDETDSPPRASVRVTHVARRDGEVVARQRRVVSLERERSDAPSSVRRERVESRNRTVARALRTRATRGTQDGRLPATDWRAAHRDALVALIGTRSRGMASAASEPAPVSAERDDANAPNAPMERYGVEADLALGYGSASQPFSRSKTHVPGDPARRSTTRTFRDDPEVARAVARVARARDSKAADAATLAAASKAIRGRSTAASDENGASLPCVGASEGVERSSPDAVQKGAPPGASRGRRLAARGGLGGGNLPFEAPAEASVHQSSRSATADETRETRRSVGSSSRSRAPTRSAAHAGDPTSPASHIARLGALSASFSDRQRAMVGRGVQEARTRIRDERSWGK